MEPVNRPVQRLIVVALALVLLVPVGALDPDHIHTPGIYVDRLIQTVSEKRIEQRTVRQRSAA